MVSHNALHRWWSQVAKLKFQCFYLKNFSRYFRKTFALTMTASCLKLMHFS